MIEIIFAVALVAGLGALFGGLKGARIAVGAAVVIVPILFALVLVCGYSAEQKHTRIREQREQEETQRHLACVQKYSDPWEQASCEYKKENQ